jgi:hypothetical protein
MNELLNLSFDQLLHIQRNSPVSSQLWSEVSAVLSAKQQSVQAMMQWNKEHPSELEKELRRKNE